MSTTRDVWPEGLAGDYFKAQMDFQNAEQKLEAAIAAVFGLPPDDVHADPYETETYDWYDLSFELKNATPGWKPTDEQFEKLFALGFLQCWICRRDGTEFYRHSNGMNGEKPNKGDLNEK